MASFLLRGIPESLFAKLKIRAARNGRSADEEAMAILSEAVLPRKTESSPAVKRPRQARAKRKA
jgi:plasmid stability protein